MTEIMFPNALRAIRKFSARDDFWDPKTELKKREAASCLEVFREALGTGLGVSGPSFGFQWATDLLRSRQHCREDRGSRRQEVMPALSFLVS
jgi:hypothetical protein